MLGGRSRSRVGQVLRETAFVGIGSTEIGLAAASSRTPSERAPERRDPARCGTLRPGAQHQRRDLQEVPARCGVAVSPFSPESITIQRLMSFYSGLRMDIG
jgi:hypothetical protein